MDTVIILIIVVLILILIYKIYVIKTTKELYYSNLEHVTPDPTFDDSINKKNEIDVKEDVNKELAIASGNNSIVPKKIVTNHTTLTPNIINDHDLKTTDNMEPEIDFVDIKNSSNGKKPESAHNKSINFKTTLSDKHIRCGRPDDELLEATLSLDTLLNCEFNRLDNNTQVNYLFYKYFKGEDEEKQQYFDLIKKRSDNMSIERMPYGDNCSDIKTDCQKRAEAGECVVNPDMMLRDCAKSCRACALTDDDKQKITKIIESRPSYGCLYYEQ